MAPDSGAPAIAIAGQERVDELRELWLALHRHHLETATLQPLVQDEELSWQRRRRDYLDFLGAGRAFLLIASDTPGGPPLGYAFVRIERGEDDTFPMGDRYAELYTLSVAPAARNRGVGTRLMDALDAELADRGIADLKVGVMAGNDRARRFYERRGLRTGEVLLYRFGRRD